MEQNLLSKEILSVMEVANFLSISRPKAYQLVNTKGFPSFRIGKTIRIYKAKLIAWIEENTLS
ncbi:excisionase family DNA binding protein [Clostridium pascui]|uniref:helix-turn-helix domain-containing protein n=1 Tax=Clostridium pascui TaxID=46609 RepID=UPI00195A19B4|nr:helix-turn-helix domain-containing protein [Clostridium pascui]MBM7872247.1 excisionase family DNA binding protein [Clostridium pascui]